MSMARRRETTSSSAILREPLGPEKWSCCLENRMFIVEKRKHCSGIVSNRIWRSISVQCGMQRESNLTKPPHSTCHFGRSLRTGSPTEKDVCLRICGLKKSAERVAPSQTSPKDPRKALSPTAQQKPGVPMRHHFAGARPRFNIAALEDEAG